MLSVSGRLRASDLGGLRFGFEIGFTVLKHRGYRGVIYIYVEREREREREKERERERERQRADFLCLGRFGVQDLGIQGLGFRDSGFRDSGSWVTGFS